MSNMESNLLLNECVSTKSPNAFFQAYETNSGESILNGLGDLATFTKSARYSSSKSSAICYSR
jgi:hypothetical protein